MSFSYSILLTVKKKQPLQKLMRKTPKLAKAVIMVHRRCLKWQELYGLQEP